MADRKCVWRASLLCALRASTPVCLESKDHKNEHTINVPLIQTRRYLEVIKTTIDKKLPLLKWATHTLNKIYHLENDLC